MKTALMLAAILALYGWVGAMDYELEVAIAAERAAQHAAPIAKR